MFDLDAKVKRSEEKSEDNEEEEEQKEELQDGKVNGIISQFSDEQIRAILLQTSSLQNNKLGYVNAKSMKFSIQTLNEQFSWLSLDFHPLKVSFTNLTQICFVSGAVDGQTPIQLRAQLADDTKNEWRFYASLNIHKISPFQPYLITSISMKKTFSLNKLRIVCISPNQNNIQCLSCHRLDFVADCQYQQPQKALQKLLTVNTNQNQIEHKLDKQELLGVISNITDLSLVKISANNVIEGTLAAILDLKDEHSFCKSDSFIEIDLSRTQLVFNLFGYEVRTNDQQLADWDFEAQLDERGWQPILHHVDETSFQSRRFMIDTNYVQIGNNNHKLKSGLEFNKFRIRRAANVLCLTGIDLFADYMSAQEWKSLPINNYNKLVLPRKHFLREYVKNAGVFNWSSSKTNLLELSSSPLGFESLPLVELMNGVNYSRVMLTADETMMNIPWLMISFLASQLRVSPLAYALRHYSHPSAGDVNDHCLRSWRLDALLEKQEKWLLLAEHVNDQSLQLSGDWTLFDLLAEQNPSQAWSLQSSYFDAFRLQMTGNNSNGNEYMLLSDWEMYGFVRVENKTEVEEVQKEEEEEKKEEDEQFEEEKEEDEARELKVDISDASEAQARVAVQMKKFSEWILSVEKNSNSNLNSNSNSFPDFDLSQILNDYSQVRRKCALDDNYYQLLHELITEHVQQQQQLPCLSDISKCPSVIRNSRDRLKVDSQSSTKWNDIQSSIILEILDSIHVQIFHGFDSGLRLKQEQKKQLKMSNKDEDDEQEEEEVFSCVDHHSLQIRKLIANKFEKYIQLRHENNPSSKFVTQINQQMLDSSQEQKEANNENANNNNNNEDEEEAKNAKTKHIYYSFGWRFYYWLYFKTDKWFIPKKFENIKQELLYNQLRSLPKEVFDKLYEKAIYWTNTNYYRATLSNNKWTIQYGLPAEIPIEVRHILVVLLYCNFSKFCSLFSSTYRRIPNTESDEDLLTRHSNFRDFGRLLRESVEVYGTSFEESEDVDILYHGISIEMMFEATYAKFCAPTSCTRSFMVAVNFAKSGIIIELKNDLNANTFYFDCSIVSDFSNEDERLILGGHTFIPFISIHNIASNLDFQLFIRTITCLQFMLNGKYSNIRVTKDMRKVLSKMVRFQLLNERSKKVEHERESESESAEHTKLGNKLPQFIQVLFAGVVKNLKQAIFSVKYLNSNNNKSSCVSNDEVEYHFVVFRSQFCEFYSKPELSVLKKSMKRRLTVNKIRNFKWELISELFPNLEKIEIHYLPLTKFIIEGFIQQFIQPHQRNKNGNNNNKSDKNIETKVTTIVIKYHQFLYRQQSDFRSYQECQQACEGRFSQFKDWSVKVEVDDGYEEYLLISNVQEK